MGVAVAMRAWVLAIAGIAMALAQDERLGNGRNAAVTPLMPCEVTAPGTPCSLELKATPQQIATFQFQQQRQVDLAEERELNEMELKAPDHATVKASKVTGMQVDAEEDCDESEEKRYKIEQSKTTRLVTDEELKAKQERLAKDEKLEKENRANKEKLAAHRKMRAEQRKLKTQLKAAARETA